MRIIYQDQFCRLIQTDNKEVGSRKKEYRLVAFDSDYLPPHWPTQKDMLRSYREIQLLDIQRDK